MNVGGQDRQCNGTCEAVRAMTADTVESPMFQSIDDGLDLRMRTPRRHKGFLRFPLPVGLRKIPLARQRIDVEQRIKPDPVVGAVKAPVETARPQLGIQCLCFVHHRHGDVHVLGVTPNFVVKDELILVLDDGDRDAEFYRRTRLAFGNPARVLLEDREDLLRVRNRLVLQKPALNLIDLTPSMSDEALDGLTRGFPRRSCPVTRRAFPPPARPVPVCAPNTPPPAPAASSPVVLSAPCRTVS